MGVIHDILAGTGKRSSPDCAPLLIALGVIDDSHTSVLLPYYPPPWYFKWSNSILEHDLSTEHPVSHLQTVYIK